MLKARTSRTPRELQRGLSLVEMMVGVTVGLFIVAGATVLAASQLSENRRLLLEAQVQQDLRASADIITRELRRAGYDGNPELLMWSAQTPEIAPRPNFRGGLHLNQPGYVVSYGYDRPSPGTTTEFGYGLASVVTSRGTSGTIRQRLGSTTQELTDPNTLDVTAFTVTVESTTGEQVACPRLCAYGTQDCWPTLNVVDATVTIAGRAVSDASVSRTIISRVRLRNDALKFNVSSTQVCP